MPPCVPGAPGVLGSCKAAVKNIHETPLASPFSQHFSLVSIPSTNCLHITDVPKLYLYCKVYNIKFHNFSMTLKQSHSIDWWLLCTICLFVYFLLTEIYIHDCIYEQNFFCMNIYMFPAGWEWLPGCKIYVQSIQNYFP